MPRFTDERRERIRETLHETGRELFARYGLGKTTIAELTEPAGIATGTFYQFYDSKEELYIEILEAYGEELIPRLLGNSFEAHDDPEEAITAFLELLLAEFESNPFVHQIIVENEYERIKAQYTEEELEAERERGAAYILPYVEEWYDEGRIDGPDPETIAHAIESVSYVALHEDDIGEERYPAVRDTVISAVAAGLTSDEPS
ncbi:TetR/AcrR family transcriptional regulator [Halorarum halobium]|uniref:TetR/AcrR family transcriptional regulator n=1 Tax=Halorarum halobium TaxID=3075121 RepID=UPI0028A9F3DA|nr:TetR/AcrR family transcriptional regulator [Halobaculum sp. XH14]